ncbi:DUF3810 domain-containing protein [Lutimonas saemankumensis]|uniref:DUF3810 domain-containing protein n=1 Tax=Lutimonas saemankumensis TaxID=483016 RepID=UPI001CD1A87A|nr:DUF3810 domain-containing protein [Lutimonas saemankumensis]MCA0932138.1 DUF3810 domain-containing protein [Lutimonas saemankumensis]
MYKEKRNILLSIFLFLQIFLVAFLSGYPSFIEKYYVHGIYPVISKILRVLFGWIPLSIGDILYGILIFLLFRFIWNMIRNPKKNRKQQLFQFLAAISIFYFFFYLFWGLNYSRKPLTDSLKLEKEEFNIEQLQVITEKIIFKTKELQSVLSEHDSLPVIVPYSKEKIIDLTARGYTALGNSFPEFNYHTVSLKKSLFSLPLTYMGFAGYLNPLTGEAHVDYLIPKINLPFTCSHEVAHQLGIASENEANFVGFLASSNHSDPYFRYAGYLLVLRYALMDIRRYDKKLFKDYLDQLPKGILKNIRESDEFWKKYENPFEPLFKIFYDHYLKYNQQPDGLQTYNQIMGLLISYDKKNPL